MSAIQPTLKDRLGAGAISATLVAAIGYALVIGLAVDVPRAAESALKMFTTLPPAPPPPQPQQAVRVATPKPEGRAAPPNLKSKATEVTAPKPIVPITTPPPIPVAAQPGPGHDVTSGNADVPGPGTGSGGIGTGTGSGGRGNGGGDGGGTPPRHIAGEITSADYPPSAAHANIGGTVGVLFVVSPEGLVTDCEVTQSSGSDALDDTTCRLIIERYRYEPSRDEQGRPVESMVRAFHSWIME